MFGRHQPTENCSSRLVAHQQGFLDNLFDNLTCSYLRVGKFLQKLERHILNLIKCKLGEEIKQVDDVQLTKVKIVYIVSGWFCCLSKTSYVSEYLLKIILRQIDPNFIIISKPYEHTLLVVVPFVVEKPHHLLQTHLC